MDKPVRIVGAGGSTRDGSSSELALRIALRHAARLGAETQCFAGEALVFPMYDPVGTERSPRARAFVEALRECDGLILASPGYHGSIAGLFKNALDYTEDLRTDRRVYLDGRAVGCVACASGWQATGSTLSALRDVVHALRAWPTPLGVGINSQVILLGPDGHCSDARTVQLLHSMAEQVVEFAYMARSRATPSESACTAP